MAFRIRTVGLASAGLLAASMAVGLGSAQAAAPATYYVNGASGTDSGTCGSATAQCKTIQQGLDNARSGDTVSVAAGTYNESIHIDQAVTLTGASGAVIDGAGTDQTDGRYGIVYVGNNVGDVSVSGFTIQNPAEYSGNADGDSYTPIAVVLHDNNSDDTVSVSDNTIIGNPNFVDDGEIGVYSLSNAATTTISDNDVSGFFQGVLLENNGPATVSGNTFHDLTAAGGYPAEGVFILADAEGALTEQNVTDNTFRDYGGIGIQYRAGYDLGGCSGTGCDGSVSGEVTDNTFALAADPTDRPAAAFVYQSYNPGDTLTLTTGGNTGTVAAPTQVQRTVDPNEQITTTNNGTPDSVQVAPAYEAVTPTRVVDTRINGNALHNGPLAAGTSYTLDLSKTSVPRYETAYVFNVTAVHPATAGNLSIKPQCPGVSTSATTSVVNYQANKDVANDLVLSNPCNVFSVTSTNAAADVLLDLQGYFTSPDGFAGTTPTRVVDTRSGLGGDAGAIPGNSSKTFTLPDVPDDVTAVAINLTAITPSGAGNAKVYPADVTTPATSNLNYVKGVDKAVFAIVRLPANHQIRVFSEGSAANVAIDVYGYVPDISTATVLSQPERAYDSRTSDGPIAVGTPRNVVVANEATGVPSSATAVIVSLTAVRVAGGKGFGNLKAYAAGSTPGTISNINYIGPNADVANMAIVPINDGTISLATEGSSTNAIVDVVGYIEGTDND